MYVHIRFGAHHANSGNKKNSALLQQRKNNSPLSVCPQQPEQTYATPQAKPPRVQMPQTAKKLIYSGMGLIKLGSWNTGVASSSLCASDWTFLLSFSWRLNSLHNTSARIACVFCSAFSFDHVTSTLYKYIQVHTCRLKSRDRHKCQIIRSLAFVVQQLICRTVL